MNENVKNKEIETLFLYTSKIYWSNVLPLGIEILNLF